ncbi:LPS assembly lipoprotein LptE [Alkanindiges sp. WGS2144]|uniref:LPS-assembly lipoprotein LptE n=1 Tax=Alkanindiges sp. WGS2144 TaxID=3366808 RepID=UPI0037508DC8
MKRTAVFLGAPLLCISLGLVSSCGFHLRGTQTSAIPVDYQHVQLSLPPQAKALHEPLSVYLQSLGAAVDQDKNAPVIKITDYQQTRQLLSGRLTEVQLRLAITYHIENSLGEPLTTDYSVYARRSYQYDIATVNTENQEETHLIEEMNLDAATQIARQLHAGRMQYTISSPTAPAP